MSDARHQLAEHLRFYRNWASPASAAIRVARACRRLPNERRPSTPGADAGAAGADPGVPMVFATSAAEALPAIRDDIGECTRCKLHTQGRKQIVFGVGNPQPT